MSMTTNEVELMARFTDLYRKIGRLYPGKPATLGFMVDYVAKQLTFGLSEEDKERVEVYVKKHLGD